MSDLISYVLPGEKLESLNQRGKWQKHAARIRRQRHLAAMLFHPARRKAWGDGPLPLPLVVTIVRCAPRLLDDDNAVGSAKHVRDGVADALGLEGHDRNPHVLWVVTQERAATYAVRIEIAGKAREGAG